MVELDLREVGSDCSWSVSGVLDSEDGEVALGVVVEVLAGGLAQLRPSAYFQIDAFQTFSNQVRYLLSVDPLEVDPFATVESQVVGVLPLLPVTNHEGCVASC